MPQLIPQLRCLGNWIDDQVCYRDERSQMENEISGSGSVGLSFLRKKPGKKPGKNPMIHTGMNAVRTAVLTLLFNDPISQV